MADAEGGGIEMKDLTSTSFGYIIAFLLPGLFTLYGLGFWSDQAAEVAKPAMTTSAAVGPSVILLLAALAIGLIVSALRYYIFERGVCHKLSLDRDMFTKLAPDKLISFKAVVDEHYRYHQFYGGCFVAGLVTYFGWLWNSYRNTRALYIAVSVVVFVVLEVVLALTAHDTYKKYCERASLIVKG